MEMTTRVQSALTSELAPETLDAIHRLVLLGFDGDFPEEDWEHTVGGRHFFITADDEVVSHASVVPRILEAGGHSFRTGYVEGVATHPEHRGQGFGSAVVKAASDHIRAAYEFGGLGSDLFSFYERAGWERWRGPTFVRRPDGLFHTEEEDGFVMVLRFGPSTTLDLTAPISCDDRSGDVW